MELKDKIYAHLREYNFAENYVWKPQNYLNAFVVNLNPIEHKDFKNTMNELCNEGIFNAEGNTELPTYRLTKKGEKEIW